MTTLRTGAFTATLTTACVLVATLAVGPLHAQVLYGSLVVDVRDQSGAAVVGAEVTITQTETNWTRSGTTNETGTASFATVPLGTFSVRVVLSGFNESVTTDVRVTQDNVTRVTTGLTLGQLTDTVTVSAGACTVSSTPAAA